MLNPPGSIDFGIIFVIFCILLPALIIGSTLLANKMQRRQASASTLQVGETPFDVLTDNPSMSRDRFDGFTSPPRDILPNLDDGSVDFWRELVATSSGKMKHVLISGETDSGKTTIAMALIKERSRRGKFIVVDTNAKRNQWGDGIVPIGARGKLQEAESFFVALLAELEKRQQKYFDDEPIEPLTVVIEEVNDLVKFCPSVSECIQRISSMGRKYDLLLILCGQSDRVKSLGVEGQGDLRYNFVTIRLMTKATEKSGVAAPYPNRQRPASVERGGKIEFIDTSFFLKYKPIPVDVSRLWQGYSVIPYRTIPDETLLFEPRTMVRNGTERHGTSPDSSRPGDESPTPPVEISEKKSKARERLVVAGIKDGLSNDEIYQAIGGNRADTLNFIKGVRHDCSGSPGVNGYGVRSN